jgi:hypothetical protein
MKDQEIINEVFELEKEIGRKLTESELDQFLEDVFNPEPLHQELPREQVEQEG